MVEEIRDLGQQVMQHARFVQEPESLLARTVGEKLLQFLENAGRRSLEDLLVVAQDGVVGRGLDVEIEARGEADGPDHAHRVFTEADVRVPDAADEAVLDVREASHVVDDGEMLDLVEEPVDGEIAPQGVLFGRAVAVVAEHVQILVAVLLLLVRAAPEGRGLDDVVVEADVRQPEPAADQEAVLEDLLDLAGRGVCADVEILGRALEDEVAHAAAHEIGGEALAPQSVQNLQGVRVDVLAGDGMV